MWVLLSVFIITAWFLGSVAQVTAETWKLKFFSHVTKLEVLPVPGAEGHFVGTVVREGVSVFENGELAWHKAVISFDTVNGIGPFTQYSTTTFQDGSTITSYSKDTAGSATAEWTAEIIHGTGRFQGIKGTTRATTKFLPLEKGEMAPKSLGEATITYTLPSK